MLRSVISASVRFRFLLIAVTAGLIVLAVATERAAAQRLALVPLVLYGNGPARRSSTRWRS